MPLSMQDYYTLLNQYQTGDLGAFVTTAQQAMTPDEFAALAGKYQAGTLTAADFQALVPLPTTTMTPPQTLNNRDIYGGLPADTYQALMDTAPDLSQVSPYQPLTQTDVTALMANRYTPPPAPPWTEVPFNPASYGLVGTQTGQPATGFDLGLGDVAQPTLANGFIFLDPHYQPGGYYPTQPTPAQFTTATPNPAGGYTPIPPHGTPTDWPTGGPFVPPQPDQTPTVPPPPGPTVPESPFVAPDAGGYGAGGASQFAARYPSGAAMSAGGSRGGSRGGRSYLGFYR